MVAPLLGSVLVVVDVQRLKGLAVVEDRGVVPVLLRFPGDDITVLLHQRVEFLVHMAGIFLKGEDIRQVVVYEPGELRGPVAVTWILTDFLPFRRNGVLAVVPDVVVKDAEVSAFRDLELRLERRALLRESESSVEQESECQRRSRDDSYNSVHYSNVF